jgi:hypothetical protein
MGDFDDSEPSMPPLPRPASLLDNFSALAVLYPLPEMLLPSWDLPLLIPFFHAASGFVCCCFDLLPLNLDILNWNFPIMIQDRDHGEFHESKQIHGGADRLHPEAGGGRRRCRGEFRAECLNAHWF